MDKILIIEDDQVLVDSAADILSGQGFSVLKAYDGAMGVTMAHEQLPDLILCDIYMPKLNGYEVFEKVKQDVSTSLIPFIFLTAKSETEDILYAMKMGVDDYITKPIDFDELTDRISKRLNKTKEAIKRSEIKYHAIFENAHDAIILIRLSDYQIIDANQAACGLLEYTLPEILDISGKPFITFPGKESGSYPLLINEEEKKSEFHGVETTWKTKKGKRVLIEASGKIIHLFSEPLLYMIVRDISEIKEKEKALFESEERNRNLLENIGEGISVVDGNEEFSYANPAAERIFGVEKGTLVGKNLTVFLSDPSVKIVLEETSRRKRNERTIYELEIIRTDGTSRLLMVTASPHYTVNGEFAGTFAIFRDITEQKLYEDQLILSKEKAEESDRLKTSILSNISHELRTPLNGILGFSELLMEELQNTEYLQMVENIHFSGRRLMSTLNSIITHSQLQAGKVTMVFKNSQLGPTIQKLTESFRDEADRKQLHLSLELEEEVMAYTDLPLFQQLLRQLIDNAVKFTLRGGITVRTKRLKKDQIDWQTIDIEDTGIGIDQPYLDMIFDEFRQVSEGYDRKFQGSGLGLSICRKISDLLNGKITVRSTPGKGTLFTVWLPVEAIARKRMAIPPPGKATEAASEGNKRKKHPDILLVEDNIINKNLIERFVSPTYKLDHAIDGKTAIRMSERKQYDVILMDINLGAGIDGIQTTKSIRTIPGYELVPIIAVTGYTMIGDREKLLEEGCTHYLSKPFEKALLLRILEDAISGK